MEKEPSIFRNESNESPEEIVVTARENAILNTLTPEDVAKVRELKQENLTVQSKDIVGVRVEDLFYFLEAVHNGYLPVGGADIRRKEGESHIFLTPNPMCDYLKQERQDLYGGIRDTEKTFLDVTKETIRNYGAVARSQGVYRNLWDKVLDKDDLIKESVQRYSLGDEKTTDAEEFFDLIAEEIKKKKSFIDCEKPRYKMAYLLNEHLDPSVPRADVTKLLRSLANRSGIVIAFNKKLLEAGDATTTDQKILDLPGSELAVGVPSGRIPLDAMLGYEALGHFEDEIERKIGVVQ